jgi:hypothetical protein
MYKKNRIYKRTRVNKAIFFLTKKHLINLNLLKNDKKAL